jgi:hypothetical protein
LHTEKPSSSPLWTDCNLQIRGAAALLLLLCLILVLFRVLKKELSPAPLVADGAVSEGGAAPFQTPPASETPQAPGMVASTQEMGKAWSVAKFQMKLATGENAAAMVIHLPGRTGAGAYWGLLSVAPYGQCEMELVTDLTKIARQYEYRARHPMLVDSCTQTIYDPMSYGAAHGRWIRGQVVKGTGLRPPMAVEILIQKGNLIATRTE